MKRIYLDHAATTPLDKRVAKTMRDFELEYFGNPNSIHREGQEARAEIDSARSNIAKFFNAKPQEIIFTSGATEANNLAIQGVVSYAINETKIKPHIITTKLEHQSVYNLVKMLESRGVADATFINPDKNGLINPADIVRNITDATVLISCIFVSNEIGSVLPVRELGRMIAEVNIRQKNKILFHIDAVQAVKFFNCNVEKLGCDLMTVSAHKVYGPKGIGALYVKTGSKLNKLLYGGSQEYGKRPGTQNTAGIIGMGQAFKFLGSLDERLANAEKISKLRDQLITGIKQISKVDLNGPEGELRTADNVNFTIYNVDQDALVASLDLAGISASTGSACVSGSTETSHVIKSLGKTLNKNSATVRFTLGRSTTSAEIKTVIEKLITIIKQLRHEK